MYFFIFYYCYNALIALCTVGSFSLCHDGQSLISGSIGLGRSFYREPRINRYQYTNLTTLNITRHSVKQDNCVRIEWVGHSSSDLPLLDCFDITNDVYWYGGYEVFNQHWPINDDVRNMTPFLPRDIMLEDASLNWFGPIIHPVWYNSKGVVLYVDEDVPLHVSVENNGGNKRICLQSVFYSAKCFPSSLAYSHLKYTICGFENISQSAQYFLKESLAVQHPNSTPSIDLFLKPIWTSWAAMKTNVSLDNLKDFASKIVPCYPISQLEIDDKYSTYYGELSFDPIKFPSNTDINATLSALGVPGISAWVHPFIEPSIPGFSDLLQNGTFLPGDNVVDGNSVSLIKWWNGYAGVINFASESIRQWQAQRLNDFVRKYSLAGLKFDAGGDSYVPQCIYIKGLTHPGGFSKDYVEFVASQSYSDRTEVRVGYFNQGQPLLFRILDFRSVWGIDHGLRSVIPTVLSLGLAGYPFILPDIIGGNGYNNTEPDKELYVRWLQLNTFLPVMQLSYGPWRYNDPVIETHATDMMKLHENITTQYILPLFNDAMKYNYPLIHPVWWVAPNDETALRLNDQFLLGDTLLVAPIVTQGALNRTVYFPAGSWKCLSSACSGSPSFQSGWSKPISVTLTDILYFKKEL